MATLLNAPAAEKKPLPHVVEFFTAAAPPPEAVLAAMKEAGFNVTHVYGLTETYGPAMINEWHDAWDALPPAEQAAKKARQGVRYVPLEALDVLDPDTHARRCRATARRMGEVMFRGNVVMKGYLKNKPATEKAFAGGWFHSGDLGVMHPDGYIQLKDRSKDIIISGGENISSIEVEDALYKHPAVQAAAVVAKPDDKWGETPCAFVELKPGQNATTDELIAWCRRTSRATSARATSCSRNCRRPRPGRSRNSSCARWRRRCERRTVVCASNEKRIRSVGNAMHALARRCSLPSPSGASRSSSSLEGRRPGSGARVLILRGPRQERRAPQDEGGANIRQLTRRRDGCLCLHAQSVPTDHSTSAARPAMT